MRRILITGANSYIGTCFAAYMGQWQDTYQVDTVDMLGESWREKDFSSYDCLFHVAGIAHVKETSENEHLYYEVNRDLALATAQKAKESGVKQFVFLSSMSVYGLMEGAITRDTPTAPTSHYGKSKLQAEEGMRKLESDTFSVTILRPPMVYGEGCKGNYQMLVKLAKALPVFPDYHNQRSMIHIDRLCAVVKEAIDNPRSGLILPQDETYVCTCQMVQQIAQSMGKKMHLTKALNPLVSIAKRFTAPGKKAFGSLYYDKTSTETLQ